MRRKADEAHRKGQRRVQRWWWWWRCRDQRCAHCGRRKHLDASWIGNPSTGEKHHIECSAYLHWRQVAEERLDVLDLATDLSGLTMRDLCMVAEGRATTAPTTYRTVEESRAYDRTWRVMRDLEHLRAERDGT